MTKRANASLRVGAMLVVAISLAVGCSSSDVDTAAPLATAASTTSTAVAAGGPTVTEVRQSCAAATLAGAAVASFEAPQLIDVVCEEKFATATLVNGPGGENVVLFGLQGGAWVLVGNAALADAATAAPADFSATAIPAWQRARNARLTRVGQGPTGGVAPTTATSMFTNPDTGALETCTGMGSDSFTCEPPPAVDVVEPEEPVDPNAPPTTVKQSGFCKYNYNDPRCIADPGFVE